MENLPVTVTAKTPARRVVRGALARAMGEEVGATLQAAARSEHSARSYRTALGLFLQYLDGALGGGHNLASSAQEGRATVWAFGGQVSYLRLVTPAHLAGYRAWRETEGDSANTASQRYAAVRTFLAVCYRDGILTDAQASKLGIRPYAARQKRDVKPTGRRLTKAEVRDLRAACDPATVKGKRDLAILDLALFAGLRCDEIAKLGMENLRPDGGRWWLVFAGKGDKSRRVKVHDVLYASLAAWLEATERSIGQGAGGVFWPVNRGDAYTPGELGASVINRLVAEYGAKAGLAEPHGAGRLGPHDLRRTCARNAYENGAPLPMIQRMLGHADIQTSMRYIGAEDGNGGGAVDFVRYDVVAP
jgi:integrase